MDYYLLATDRPLDGALREYLTMRQGRTVMGFLSPWFLAGAAAGGPADLISICCGGTRPRRNRSAR